MYGAELWGMSASRCSHAERPMREVLWSLLRLGRRSTITSTMKLGRELLIPPVHARACATKYARKSTSTSPPPQSPDEQRCCELWCGSTGCLYQGHTCAPRIRKRYSLWEVTVNNQRNLTLTLTLVRNGPKDRFRCVRRPYADKTIDCLYRRRLQSQYRSPFEDYTQQWSGGRLAYCHTCKSSFGLINPQPAQSCASSTLAWTTTGTTSGQWRRRPTPIEKDTSIVFVGGTAR